MTDGAPVQRSLDVNVLLDRYRDELASTQQALFIAQAQADAAEAECAALRLRVVELEGAPAAR